MPIHSTARHGISLARWSEISVLTTHECVRHSWAMCSCHPRSQQQQQQWMSVTLGAPAALATGSRRQLTPVWLSMHIRMPDRDTGSCCQCQCRCAGVSACTPL